MTLQSSYIFLKKECASKKDHVDSAGNKILVIEVGHRIHNYIMKLFPGASSEKITDELFKNKITYVMQVRDDFYHVSFDISEVIDTTYLNVLWKERAKLKLLAAWNKFKINSFLYQN